MKYVHIIPTMPPIAYTTALKLYKQCRNRQNAGFDQCKTDNCTGCHIGDQIDELTKDKSQAEIQQIMYYCLGHLKGE